MSRKNLKGIVNKVKGSESLPDFLSCLFRRRRNWNMFAVENNIVDAESLEAFLEQNSDKFSFSDEFFDLVQPLVEKKKEKKKKTEEVKAPEATHKEVVKDPEPVSELFFVATAVEPSDEAPSDDSDLDDSQEDNDGHDSFDGSRKKNKKKKS